MLTQFSERQCVDIVWFDGLRLVSSLRAGSVSDRAAPESEETGPELGGEELLPKVGDDSDVLLTKDDVVDRKKSLVSLHALVCRLFYLHTVCGDCARRRMYSGRLIGALERGGAQFARERQGPRSAIICGSFNQGRTIIIMLSTVKVARVHRHFSLSYVRTLKHWRAHRCVSGGV